ncbi:glycoside hydrolase family 15 protein [Lyngbya confervoides]|uniref:Glycoside hydrolase family 15 protein n=1 Tax=Lyngbya confervoides BDU141951 TaxID=1574623 RepID=A0ABD4T3M0_9CYAN|nr:glycoside hydrolase family 15 protein [Lyngbya confervoides]MCM1983122.1 glycoside hydrolase family 15 protein [Lyngbya confervoides BDU141951]
MGLNERSLRLSTYYEQIQETILKRQDPLSGLLPASTAINEHGNYTDAWVRDNVYSILAVWGLSLAYRKLDDDQGRTYELEHCVIKLMRGLLHAMMRQAHKVERFKETQSPLDALHAKYHTRTGDPVVGDDQWGHLQLDATSLYLLILAQMIESGLSVIYTRDEVDFIQNLVYYIGRTYRTPDYGIWERGNKLNHGKPELNASSLGMAKAALEALNGFNLFGIYGSQASVIQVLPDEIARSRATLESMLPRESSSKEVDAALLSIIGFPAFAVDNADLCDRTRQKIIDQLQGRYGCKRFLRDGHQTVIEDSSRLHYEPSELKQFEHIECEWPLFFAYLLLDAAFRHESQQVRHYRQALARVAVQQNGYALLPEVYYVPQEALEAERQQPQSQPRQPNQNLPLVWAQSLFYLGEMLSEGLLELGDLDPLGRHLQIKRKPLPVVQVALLAEDESLQQQLSADGIPTQTPAQVAPILVHQAKDLGLIFTQIGRNDRLGISGRPLRRMRSLTTSRIFRIQGETVVFLPALLDQQQFYLTVDPRFLVNQIRSELAYIQRHWSSRGRPTVTLLLKHTMFETSGSIEQQPAPMIELLRELETGRCGDVSIQTGRLNPLMLRACVEQIGNIGTWDITNLPCQDLQLFDHYLQFDSSHIAPLSADQELSLEQESDSRPILQRLRETDNLYEQVELLEALARLETLNFDTGLGQTDEIVTVAALLEEVYNKAIDYRQWDIMRWVAGLNDKVVTLSLADAVTDILARQKQISVGRAYSEDSLIQSPLSPQEILAKIRKFCRYDMRDRVLTQEMLIYLSLLLKAEPSLFDGMITIRVGHLILLLTSELSQTLQIPQDEAYEHLMAMSPHDIQTHLHSVLCGYQTMNQTLMAQESLQSTQSNQDIDWVVLPQQNEPLPEQGDWFRKRQLEGSVNRVPKDFYPRVWTILKHCRGLVIGDKLERRNRLDSEPLLSEMTAGEKNFALKVEHLLNKIQSPVYRQINIECLMELAAIAEGNPDLQIQDFIVLDILIGHAVRLVWLDRHPSHQENYDEHKAEAWQYFYQQSPYDCASYIVKALQFLTHIAQERPPATSRR